MNLRVKEILKEKGISQKELADKLEITEVGLSKSLNGNPPLKRLEDIALALNIPITELFEQPKSSSFNCPNCGASLEIVEKYK